MKYKLINKTTGEEHICEKVVIDGWDYYVSDEGVVNPCYFYNKPTNYLGKALRREGNFWVCENIEGFHLLSEAKKVIATNNPSIDIPKVVDKDEKVALMAIRSSKKFASKSESDYTLGFIAGYKESQETHPFSEEDMIEFNEWCSKNYEFDNRCNHWFHGNGYYTTKELLQLWKEQRTKTLYYE